MKKANNIIQKWALVLYCCGFAMSVFADKHTLPEQEQPLLTLLEIFSEKYHIHFSYNPVELYDIQVNFEFDESEDVDTAIQRLLSSTHFHYESFGAQFYVIYEKSKAGQKDVRKLRKHWKEIQKLEQKGNLSLRKSNAKNKLQSALDGYSALEKARWSFGKISDETTKETLVGRKCYHQRQQYWNSK